MASAATGLFKEREGLWYWRYLRKISLTEFLRRFFNDLVRKGLIAGSGWRKFCEFSWPGDFPLWWKVLCISKPYCIYFDLALCNWTRIWISYQAFLCCQIARFVMEERRTSERKERYRLVVPKHAQTKDRLRDPHSKQNRGNAIKTTKYSIWSFLPKNLFEQFHRFANIYFLVIVILNLIPEINAFGKYIAMAPLIFVLSVTAIKDLFEDRRRYRSDKAVNNSTCFVFNR